MLGGGAVDRFVSKATPWKCPAEKHKPLKLPAVLEGKVHAITEFCVKTPREANRMLVPVPEIKEETKAEREPDDLILE